MRAVTHLPVARAWAGTDFDDALRALGYASLARATVETLQVNVGKLCNMACHHQPRASLARWEPLARWLSASGARPR
jgi:hypothetical protein